MPRALTVAAARALGIAVLGIAACGDSHTPGGVCMQAPAARTVPRTQCGPTADFTPINSYHGDIASIQDREDAVALVGGICTGTLIAAAAGPVVLTAGHCFALGDRMIVAFNVEADPDGDPLATGGTVFELSSDPDYALIRLDQLPIVAPTALTTRASDLVAVIQHPRGGPKVIAEGDLLGECQDMVFYDVDTLGGSSGAGVLNRQGYLLGVHIEGDCASDGSGSNDGWTTASIVATSAYLQDVDIADR